LGELSYFIVTKEEAVFKAMFKKDPAAASGAGWEPFGGEWCPCKQTVAVE